MKKRIISLLLVGVLVIGTFSGCGGKGKAKKGGTSSQDVEISYWHTGLGVEWLDRLIEAFNKEHPEYNVYYNASASEDAATAGFGLADTDTVDLYMTGKEYDTRYLEPLTDLLDSTLPGDKKTLKEKFDSSYLGMEETDGNYYSLTYGGGILGFVYNKDIFSANGITQLPRTTDELALVCTTLKDNKVTPLCHFKSGGYYHFMNEVWFAQYDGLDYYFDFYKNPSKKKMTTKDGRYEAIKVHEKINNPDNVLQGSNSDSHVSIQTKFLEGQCAMMLTGSWLSSEMNNSNKIDTFAMMKTPVISSITDKLTTVKGEMELRKLITAIDNVTDGVETIETYKKGDSYVVDGKKISAKDWEYVEAARNSMAANYSGETCYIPNYSNAKDGAKEFLKFMYSDAGYKVYTDTLHITLPMSLSEGEIDTSNWNAFEQGQADLFAKTKQSICNDIMSKHKLFTDGGANSFALYEFTSLMCAKNEADRVNADQAWQEIVTRINDKYDNEWMLNIK